MKTGEVYTFGVQVPHLPHKDVKMVNNTNNYTDEEKLEILINFARNISDQQVEPDYEIVQTINENLEDLLL